MNRYSLVYTGENTNWYILLLRIYVKKIRDAHRYIFKNVHSGVLKVKTLKQRNDHKRELFKYISYPYVGYE